MRLAIHVRPGASSTAAGGTHDGALVVRVTAPADGGRATAAALGVLADALGVPRRSVVLVRGAHARRKLVDVEVDESARPGIEQALARLRAAHGSSAGPTGRATPR